MGAVTLIRSEDIERESAILKSQSAIKAVLGNNGEKYRFLLLTYKDVKNKAEWHDYTDDIYIVVAGNASFCTGGKMINPQRLNENDVVGDSIQDGVEQQIKQGDIILVPTKTPHQLDVINSEVTYLLVKVK